MALDASIPFRALNSGLSVAERVNQLNQAEASQIKNNLMMQEAQAAQEQRQVMNNLRPDIAMAYRGDKAALQRVYQALPQYGYELEKAVTELGKTRSEAAYKQMQQLKERMGVLGDISAGAAQQLRQNPQAWGQIKGQIQSSLGEMATSDFGQSILGINDPAVATQALDLMAAFGIGAKGMMDQQFKERGFQADQQQRAIQNNFERQKIGIAAMRASRPDTVVNIGAQEDELSKELSKQTGKQWASYLDAGARSGGLQQDFEALEQLLLMAPQGPVVGRLAEAFPGFDSAGAAFNSIVKRLAPQFRVEGSGSTSNIEYEGMLQSLPQLSNYPEANRWILTAMQNKARINQQVADVVTRYQEGEYGSVAEAQREINEITNQSILTPELSRAMQGLREGRDLGTSPAAQTPPPPPGYDPAEWGVMWQNASPESREKILRGLQNGQR